jgi:hypothetical protein
MTAPSPLDVEVALHELAGVLEVSPPPDYATLVQRRLESAPRPRFVVVRARRTSRLLVAAAALLAALVTTVAVPATRHALASWFGFSGIDIRTAPSTLPPLPPPSTPMLTPSELGLGTRTTLAGARSASADRLKLPAGLGSPRAFVYSDEGATVVTLAYRHAPGLRPTPDTGFALLITEVFDAGQPVLEKLLHTGATTSEVTVHGQRGVYIRGPQEIMDLDPTRTRNGQEVVHEVAPRASANTIIWSDRDATYRIEADMSRSVALALARGLH